LKIAGIYKGENIFVENPYSFISSSFCVTEILVNNNVTTDEINSSFFEIDLSLFNFKFGDFVRITIKHGEACTPRILNKEVLTPTASFQIKSISINEKGILLWSTINEHGSLPFIIEQHKWNKWIRVGSVVGKGSETLNKYNFDIDFHTGNNRFRIKQVGSNKKAKYSQVVEFNNNAQEITFIPGNGENVEKIIYFTSSTRYEIFDYYGKHVKTGFNSEVDVTKLKKGTYFLNYDNKTETFVKK